MPLSRFLVDLDELLAAFHDGSGADSRSFDNLRIAVARINEIRRQLAIAEEKLGAALSLAENCLMEGGDAIVAGDVERRDRFSIYEHCRTGIDEVDDQHEAIFQAGNRLYALAYGNDTPAAEMLGGLQDLLHRVKAHFDEEEVLMDACGYPEAASHRAVHRRMHEYLAEMGDLATGSPMLVAIRLEYFLGSWLIWHMQREDMDFARHAAAVKGDIASRRAQAVSVS